MIFHPVSHITIHPVCIAVLTHSDYLQTVCIAKPWEIWVRPTIQTVCIAAVHSKAQYKPFVLQEARGFKLPYFQIYRWTWIWRTTVRRIFAYDGRYAGSQSDAYQVFIICMQRILHMTDQFSWSNWVYHIQVHLYSNWSCATYPCYPSIQKA